MNAVNRSEKLFDICVSSFLFLNLANIVAWSVGWYIHPVFYVFAIAILIALSTGRSYNVIVVLGFMLLLIVLILGYPVKDWDARSIWFFHAKRIFIDNNLYAQLDNYASWSHNDYPILLPAMAATFAKTIGYWNEIFPRTALVPLLLPVFLLFSRVFNTKSMFSFWLIGCLFITYKTLINGYADSILALYFTAACVFVSKLYLEKEHDNFPQNVALLLLLLTSLFFIKNEGLLAVLIIGMGVLPLAIKRPLAIFAVIVPIILYFIFWKWQLMDHQIKSDLFVPGIFERMLQRLSNPHDVILIFKAFFQYCAISLLFSVVVMVTLDRSKFGLEYYLPYIFSLLYTAGVVCIYFITPNDLEWHLATSASRTFTVTNLSLVTATLWILHLRYYGDTLERPIV